MGTEKSFYNCVCCNFTFYNQWADSYYIYVNV